MLDVKLPCRRTAARWVPALCLLALTAGSRACDIPVWQYALNMWGQDPYRVFYVHDGKQGDSEANALLARAARDETANITYEAVDMTRLGEASARGREIADRCEGRQLPTHAVLNPKGQICHLGLLSEEDVGSLLDSPGRVALAELLAREQGGVLLVLSGDDEQDNRRVGELAQAATEQSAADGSPVWWLQVKRDDPAERFLVAQLLSVEEDLAELRAPMVFVVFGRGHAMEPYVGRGVTAEAMGEMVTFLNGPCTCLIKEAGGGTDLLTAYDWQEQFGARPAPSAPSDPEGFVTFDTE